MRESLEGDLLAAQQLLSRVVRRYHAERLHSSLSYLPPQEIHRGNPSKRFEERRPKLFRARHRRRELNLRLRQPTLPLEEGEAVTSD
jgi:hypothetical protein